MATTLCGWDADNAKLPGTNPARRVWRGDTPLLEFNGATTNLIALFIGVVPQVYGGAALTAKLHVGVNGTSDDTDWDVEVENMVGQDLDTDGFDTVNSTDGTATPGTDIPQIISVTLTNDDSIDAGDPFRLRVTRDGISDAFAGVAWLFFLELEEA